MEHKSITSKELAKLCAVSQGTVDRALNNRKGINPITKERILKTAKQYGYSLNRSASRLSGGKSHLIGIIVFDLKNEYFSELITGIDEACKENGYALISMFTNKDKETEKQCIRRLISFGVDGIVLCTVNDGAEYAEYLHTLEIPIVTVGNRICNIPHCGIDDFQAMLALARYAMQSGTQTLYYAPVLKNPEAVNIFAQAERYRGYLSACKQKKHSPLLAMELSSVRDQINTFSKPISIICGTDYHALEVRRQFGIERAHIYSFDNIEFVRLFHTDIVSVGYPSRDIAQAVVSTILRKKKEDSIFKYMLDIK